MLPLMWARLAGTAYFCLPHMQVPGLESVRLSGPRCCPLTCLTTWATRVARPFSTVAQVSEGLGLESATCDFYCIGQSQSGGQPKGAQLSPGGEVQRGQAGVGGLGGHLRKAMHQNYDLGCSGGRTTQEKWVLLY